MKKLFQGFIIILLIGSCNSRQEDFNPLQYVDPQIGSVHGRWFFYTPGARPFGMAKLAPHTNAYNSIGSWLPCGYDDRHLSIEGFGHFHEFQVGGLVFMPVTGQVKTTPGTLDDPDAGYRSRFRKENEHSEPGYYSVELDDYNLKAEITATERVGYHRYTFPESDMSHIVFDIGHKQGESSDVTDAFIAKIDDFKYEGYIETYPEYIKFCDEGNRVKMYFAFEINKKAKSVATFVDNIVTEGATESRGIANGMYITFSTVEGEELIIKTGLSYTSIENAWLNLMTESEGKDFDSVQ